MAEKSKNSVKNSVRPQNKYLKPMKKGETLNPNGRPKGQRNYATIYREALIKIAESKNKTPEEIETMMEEVGLKQALKGHFRFFKDVRDRIHGQAEQNVKVDFNDEAQEKADNLVKGYLSDRGANKK
jgi:hypothetical protein